MRSARLLGVLVLVCFLSACPREVDDGGVRIPGDDFVVSGRVTIRPGVYRVADKNGDGVIHVRGDGTSLDLTGVTLIGAADDAPPDSFAGVGVSVVGARDVVVTGGAVRGFKIGVRAHDAPGVRLASIDASGNFRQRLKSTVEREDASDWLWGHENDDGRWERDYGAGIALRKCVGATVEACVVRRGQNGVLLDRCDEARVFDGDFSFNSGWGIALWRTCGAMISRNKADFCVRGYSHDEYARGQDSAGILVFEQCSRNWFVQNSATHGGDGFFLYAGNQTLKKTGVGGCDDNVVWYCDFSHAVANGIEATFSARNIFSRNRIEECAHGVWAGYSRLSEIYGNLIRGCGTGVSIEHGQHNVISTNWFVKCRDAVHLWWDEDADLASSPFGIRRDLRSYRNEIGPDNAFEENGGDVWLEEDEGSRAFGNVDERTPNPGRDSKLLSLSAAEGMLREPDFGRWFVPPGRSDPFLPDGALRGKKYILVDDWGPVPPTETRLFPAEVDAVGAAKLSALGVDKTFTVTSLTEGFVAEPTSGAMPATIVVRRGDEGAAPKPFEIVVKCGDDVRRARGTVSSMPWDLRFYKWTADPRTDADGWTALLAGPPVETRRVDGLDFDWKAGAVSDAVGKDRFGTRAKCEVETAAGKWRLATVSDDGIRVWVDDKLVIDDWTHHGAKPHDVELDLAAGKHSVLVEHFEIDGWAALSVSLAPVAK